MVVFVSRRRRTVHCNWTHYDSDDDALSLVEALSECDVSVLVVVAFERYAVGRA
jgi:hypothetical protein